MDKSIEIQCASCGFIGDESKFYESSVHKKFRICPICGTVRFVCNDNMSFRRTNNTVTIPVSREQMNQMFLVKPEDRVIFDCEETHKCYTCYNFVD